MACRYRYARAAGNPIDRRDIMGKNLDRVRASIGDRLPYARRRCEQLHARPRARGCRDLIELSRELRRIGLAAARKSRDPRRCGCSYKRRSNLFELRQNRICRCNKVLKRLLQRRLCRAGRRAGGRYSRLERGGKKGG